MLFLWLVNDTVASALLENSPLSASVAMSGRPAWPGTRQKLRETSSWWPASNRFSPWTTTCKRTKLDDSLTLHAKPNSEWVKDFNVRPEAVKLLEGNIGGNLIDISLGNILVDPSPQTRETKAKVNKWDHVKLKSFYPGKGTIIKNQKATYWMEEDIADSYIWLEVHIQNIKRTHNSYDSTKSKQPNLKTHRGSEQTFSPKCTDGQHVSIHDNMLNITNYQGNTTQGLLHRGFPGGSEVKKNPSALKETWINLMVRRIPWRMKMQPASVVLPGKSHVQKSLVGYSPWSCKRVRHKLATKHITHTHTHTHTHK